MKIDFSKMTKEIYDDVKTARDIIDSEKQNLMLLRAELNAVSEQNDVHEKIIKINELLNEINDYDKRLGFFEL